MFFLKAACCPCFGALEDESVTVDVATSPVNLNSASQSELEALPGIGSARAAAQYELRLRYSAFLALHQSLLNEGPASGSSASHGALALMAVVGLAALELALTSTARCYGAAARGLLD